VTVQPHPISSHEVGVFAYDVPVSSHEVRVFAYDIPVSSHEVGVFAYDIPVSSHEVRVFAYDIPIPGHDERVCIQDEWVSGHDIPVPRRGANERYQHNWHHGDHHFLCSKHGLLLRISFLTYTIYSDRGILLDGALNINTTKYRQATNSKTGAVGCLDAQSQQF
jgi:hypothetical protein